MSKNGGRDSFPELRQSLGRVLDEPIPNFNPEMLRKERDLETAFRRIVLDEYFKSLLPRRSPKLQVSQSWQYFKRSLTSVFCKNRALFSFDVEAFEKSRNVVTEIGVSIFDPRGQEGSLVPNIKCYHILIAEVLDKRNGQHVPDYKNYALNGTSYVMSRKEAVKFVQSLVDYYFHDKELKTVLIGHDLRGDLKWLASMGLRFPNGAQIVDTQKLYLLTQGQRGSSLQGILGSLEIPAAYLHNAVNDAYFTLLVAMKLCDPASRRYYGLDELNSLEDKIPKQNSKQRKLDALLKGNMAKMVYVTADQIPEKIIFTPSVKEDSATESE